jgi:hypothetical protein
MLVSLFTSRSEHPERVQYAEATNPAIPSPDYRHIIAFSPRKVFSTASSFLHGTLVLILEVDEEKFVELSVNCRVGDFRY